MTDDTRATPGTPTWYDVLGVDRDAGVEEVRAAWRSSTDRAAPGSGQFRAANQAAETLLDPARREAYDATLPPGVGEREPEAAEPDVAKPDVAEPAAAPGADVSRSTPTAEPAAGKSRRPLLRRRERPGPSVHGRPGAERPRSVGRLRRWWGATPVWALLLLVVAVAGTFALVVFLGLRVQAEARAADARIQAPVAAEEAAVAMLSYDYRQLPEDRARAERFLTGDFKDSYLESFTLLEEQPDGTEGPAVQSRAVVQAQVMASGVVDVAEDGRAARVLVFVDQTSEKAGQDPQVFQNRVAMSLEQVDERWLVSDLRSY